MSFSYLFRNQRALSRSKTLDAVLGFGCCRPTWGSAAAGEASGRGPASERPDVQEMRRPGAETAPDHQRLEYNYRGSTRILKPSASYPPSTELARSKAPAPRSLLEASARRLAVSVSTSFEDRGPQSQAADSALCLQFFRAYLDALKGANPRWATETPVADMFAQEAVLITQDNKTFQGREQVLRRLEKGVETIVKMAGKDAALPEFETSGPDFTAGRTHLIKCTLRRGVTRLTFSLEFTMASGRINLLRNSRL